MASSHAIPTGPRFQDLTGLRFHRWTVLRFFGLAPQGQAVWLCRCQCGTEKPVDATSLKKAKGGSKSCGCLRREVIARRNHKHGLWTSPEFRAWSGMLNRCQNPNDQHWSAYGGRGIKVCTRWRKSFLAFYQDMGPRPSSRHSIDRIDNDGDYKPGNCRWAIAAQQHRNRRDNHWITFRGETLVLKDWAKRFGLLVTTVQERLKRGWPVERALTTPTSKKTV